MKSLICVVTYSILMDGTQSDNKKIYTKILSGKYSNIVHKLSFSRKKRKIIAVSVIVGTMLLLGLSISIFSVLYLYIADLSPLPPSPSVNILYTLVDNNIILEHRGGKSVSLDTKFILKVGSTIENHSVGEYLNSESRDNGFWNFGERVIYPAGDITNLEVSITVVDIHSNSVIMMGILQEGLKNNLPYVTTLDATEITKTSAKLWMNYNFRGFSGSLRFSYKPSGGNWINTSWTDKSDSGSYNVSISGLTPDILYFFKPQLTYDSNVTEGDEKSFTSTITLDTFIDIITPYDIGSSPLVVTATGDPGLDNVSLWHRFSNTNWTGDWNILTYDDFEGGFGNYSIGGADCLLYTGGTYAHQGSSAANIQGANGDASSFYHTADIDVDTPGYTSIKIDFWFYSDSMESGEDFWVQFYDGSSWNIAADYDADDEFVNGQFYHEIVWINETDYTFPTDMKIKFQCDASHTNDDVYIDEIYVNASGDISIDWATWPDASNPDSSTPWNWNYDFPNGPGYYEFYSIGSCDGDSEESPVTADARCYYNP